MIRPPIAPAILPAVIPSRGEIPGPLLNVVPRPNLVALFKQIDGVWTDIIGLSSRAVQKKMHLLGDGTGYLSSAHLKGTEEVVSKQGTATLAVAVGKLTPGAGTLWSFNVRFADGSISQYEYPVSTGYLSGIIPDVSGYQRHLTLTGFGDSNANIATAIVESLTTGSDWANQRGWSARENLLTQFNGDANITKTGPDSDGFYSIQKVTTLQYADIKAYTAGVGLKVNNSSRYVKMTLRKLSGATNPTTEIIYYDGTSSGNSGTILSGPGEVSIVSNRISVSGLSETEDTVLVLVKNNFSVGYSGPVLYFYPGGSNSQTIGHGFRIKNLQIGEGATPRDYTSRLDTPYFIQPATSSGIPDSLGKLVIIGDSLVNNSVASLQLLLPATTVVGAGVGGDKSADVLARFQADVIDAGADECIIMVGTNDAYAGITTTAYQNNIAACIALADAAGVPVTLTKIPPSGSHASWTAAIQIFINTINSWIDQLGRPVVEMYSAMRNGATDYLFYVFDNGDHLHFNSIGSSVEATAFYSALSLTFTHPGDVYNDSLQNVGRAKYSILDPPQWPSAPEIIAVTGIDNAVYNADGTGKTFATKALALAAMATLADDTYLFAGTKAAALYSVDMSAQAVRIKRVVGD